MASTYGIDLTNTAAYATSYTGYYDTPLYEIADDVKSKATKIILKFARPLRTNEGVRIQYRDDLTASFTTMDDFDFTTYGAKQVISVPLSSNKQIPASEFLQLRVLLTGTTTSPELRKVILQ